MNKNKNIKKGFTMVELLVSVAIIAVMMAVAVVSYGPANKKARDGRRTADLEKMRIALEVARQIGITYPANVSLLWGSMNLMDAQPQDPKGGSYDYTVGGGGYTYTLRARMEDVGPTNRSSVSGCGSTCNYEITNP